MTRLSTRIALAVFVGIVVLAGVFFSAKAVSANTQNASLGMYVLSGGLVNPLQPQAAPEQAAPEMELKTYPNGEGGGHGGCESEGRVNPEE